MSSICGTIDLRSGRTDFERLRKMSTRLIARGGRDPVAYISGGAAISRGGEGEGAESIIFEGAVYAAVLDGEISRREELVASLGILGDISPCELVIRAYLSFGCDAFSRFGEDFAIAIWDGRRRELILARDPEGKRPLYYARLTSGVIGFASEIKGLLPIVGYAEADRGALVPMILGEEVSPCELYRGISELPPSSFCVCSSLGAQVCLYIADSAGEERITCADAELSEFFGDIPDGRELMGMLCAFDYPVYDENMSAFISCLHSVGQLKKAVIRDGEFKKNKKYALLRADRLGARFGVSVTLLPGNERRVKTSRLKKEEKELSGRARELLWSGSHLSLFCDVEKIFESLERQELQKRVRALGRLIESEYWLRSYPVCPI